MNENTPTAPGPEADGDSKASNQPADGPSTTQQAAPERPSLFERLTSLFRQRNGSNLREDIADALAESASDEAAFSLPSGRCSTISCASVRSGSRM